MQSDSHEDSINRNACRLQALLCIDINKDIRDLVSFLLSQIGYKVINTTTGAKCLTRAQQGDFDLILLDVHLSDGSGIELCKQIRGFAPHTAIVFYTTEAQQEVRLQALNAGASAYLSIPVDHINNLEFLNLVSSYQVTPKQHDVIADIQAVEQVIHLLDRRNALESRRTGSQRSSQELSKKLQGLHAKSEEVINRSSYASNALPLTSTRPTGQRKSDNE
jgi:CheY-like chemotaxis protein